jgi:hypothetical protein
MRFQAEVLVTGHGQYGPFKDAVGTEREGVTYPYIEFADPSEGGSTRATLAQGVAISDVPGVMQQGELVFELYERDRGQLKLRCHGRAGSALAAAA